MMNNVQLTGRFRCLLMAAASTCAITSAGHAQSVTPAPQTPPMVAEVIVTAQHRAERLQDVPITIATQSADQLDKSRERTLDDLTYAMPGVVVNEAGALTAPAIRGISATEVGSGTNQPIGIYLDGVYQPNMYTTHFEFSDLERIEVDKGPQGTNYGRNATGGAIAVFTKGPTFKPAGDFEVGYGNFNDVVAKGFVSGPLVGDVLAGSLSAYYERHDDFAYNIATHSRASGLDSKIFRAKLLFEPTSYARFTLTAGYQDHYDTDSGDQNPYKGNTIAAQDPHAIITTTPHLIAQDFLSHAELKDTYVTLNSQFDLGFGTLTSITSGQYAWLKSAFDDDHAYNPTQNDRFTNAFKGDAFLIYQKDHTYTEDLSFASHKWYGFSFIVGGSFFTDDNRFAPGLNYHGTTQTLAIVDYLPNTSYDGFVEGTYELTRRLVLTAGVRYTWETAADSGALFIPGVGTIQGPFHPKATFSDTTPRASIRYKVTDNTNVYFTYSTAFKSGGVVSTAFISGVPTYLPETIVAYEVGVKSTPSSRLNINASAFYYDYNNLQVQASFNGTQQIITNAGTARLYGLDADATVRLTDEFALMAGLELLNARYVNYANAFVLVPQYGLSTDPVPGGPAGNAFGPANASGKTMPRAPDVTFTLTGDYKKVFSAGTFDLTGTLYYSSRFYFDSIQRVSQGPYALLNLVASWQPRNSRFSFEVWGKNVTNTTYLYSVFEDATSDAAGYAPPTTYGVAVKYKF